jgi:hypothetical protein
MSADVLAIAYFFLRLPRLERVTWLSLLRRILHNSDFLGG